jgi:uncharacterized surface protein with fasciclin (FAS1) repeats
MKTFRASAIALAVALSAGASYLAFAPSAYADHHMKDEKGTKDIIDVATGEGMSNVTTLVAAIKAAGLVETLKGDGPFTVFAPTNEAFAKLPAGTVEDLLKPENKEKLKGILLHHVVAGQKIKAADVKSGTVKTAGGTDLNIVAEGGNVMVGDAKVIKTDVMAKNGVIHQIDTVILPPAK